MASTTAFRVDPIVGESAPTRRLRQRLQVLAGVPSTVLIRGETGTGKGVCARWLHAGSPRAREPFVHVDCSALAESLLESELFGHERGAFTGAVAARPGRLEGVGAGTLFLDEVAELAPRLQAKLLRALQDRVFERVGGSRPIPLRARLVAATHVPLEPALRAGTFREDLYFRLNVVRIELEPLRFRLEDLPALVRFGLARLGPRLAPGSAPLQPSPAFLERLRAHAWPGNVRELLNVLERVQVARLEAGPQPGDARTLSADELDGLLDAEPEAALPTEAARIESALRASSGNIAAAARRLGLARTTLRRRIAAHGIPRPPRAP